MSEHDGLTGLDVHKKAELIEVCIESAILRVQLFFGRQSPSSIGPDAIFKDDSALEATELFRGLWLEQVDFTDYIKPYGWVIREYYLPRYPECLAAQIITPLGHVLMWRHPDADAIANRALVELGDSPFVRDGFGGVHSFKWLRTVVYGWGLIRHAFTLKKES